MLRIAAAALAVFVLVGSATLIQFAWAERTEAIQTRRADCFGFGATDTDDLAYVNIFNSLQQPVSVRVMFLRGDGTLAGSPQTGTIQPDAVNSFKQFFTVGTGGPSQWLQRARVEVASGGNIHVNAAVFHDTGKTSVTERQVACDYAIMPPPPPPPPPIIVPPPPPPVVPVPQAPMRPAEQPAALPALPAVPITPEADSPR